MSRRQQGGAVVRLRSLLSSSTASWVRTRSSCRAAKARRSRRRPYDSDVDIARHKETALRVLWVTNEAPDRNLGGGSIRQAHLLEALSARAEIVLVLFGAALQDDTTRSALTRLVELPMELNRPRRGPLHRRVHDLRAALSDDQPPEVAEYR